MKKSSGNVAMAVFIYEEDAFRKMAKVEGEDWAKIQKEGGFGDYSFEAFLKAWKKLSWMTKIMKPDFGVSVNGNGAIYGEGGWNRYTVRNNGEIMFISGTAKPGGNYIEKARNAGFRIFPEDLKI